jgi:hypothetical protein
MTQAGDGKNLVTSGLFCAALVDKHKRVIAKECFGGETLGHDGIVPHEFQRDRVRAEKLFHRPGMRFRRVGGCNGLLQREKFFTRAHDKPVARKADDVRRFAAGQIEADRDSARAREGGVVRDKRVRRAVRKTNRHGNRRTNEVRSFGKRGRLA